MVAIQKLKVQYHTRGDSRGGFSDVLLSSRGNHGISVGDLIEVYHPDDIHHGLFLVTTLRDDVQTRDIISIEHSLAQFFRLQQHKTACVRTVEKESVTLDLVELHFREQYISRSDCYRITQELIGSVIQVNKKIEATEFRLQVGELWRHGEKYSCGYVGSRTKVVFRSSSAVIHAFIQLSEEMWLFDDHGDLYFEKAVKFLSKLFLHVWPENNCTHDTTVIFFTRVFIFDLPIVYQDRVNRDRSGRCYEDFYRVIVQNERLTPEEWKRVLMQLKLEFRKFQLDLNVHIREHYPTPEGAKIPRVQVSRAMEGNILETLNMALNLYASYNVDRNFDRTGKLSFVLSPGTGCFMVERQLSELTKQRILDLGFGIDLICFGPQPLHAVPMFQFVNFNSSDSPAEFLVPHWINCSFFRSAHELKRIELGLPVTRTQVFPVFDRNEIFDVPRSCTLEQTVPMDYSTDVSKSTVPFSNECVRPRTKVYQIFYPSTVRNNNSNNTDDASEPTDSIFHQGSPIFGSDGSHTMRGTPLNAYGSRIHHAANPYLMAINTASAITRGGNRRDRHMFRNSESDHSPVRNTTDWDTITVKLTSSLSRTESQESDAEKLGTQCGIKVSNHTMIVPPAPLVHSLTSVRERSVPAIGSNRMDNSGLCRSARERTDSCASERDGGLSISSSSEGVVSRGLARPRSHRPDLCPWGSPRMLSSGGPSRDQVARIHPVPGVPSHSTLTATNLNPLGTTQKRSVAHTLQICTQSGRTRASRPGGRVRTNSMLYPMLHPHNPFEIKLDPMIHAMSTCSRRWALVHPTDELGLPIPPHPPDLFALRTLELLHPITPVINLSQVWSAYFSFLRDKLRQPAPGGPNHLIDPVDHVLSATSMLRPGLFEDSRKIATVAKSHGLRSSLLPWSSNEFTPTAALRKRSECLFTESSQILQEPTTMQILRSYTRRDTEPPMNKQASVDEASTNGQSSSTTRQLLDAVRQASRKPFTCDLPNFFTVDRSLAEQRMTTLKNTLKLIAVDWKSVSTPALLPMETDYFPDNSSLKSDGYTLHDYRVVPYGISFEQWESKHHFDQEPGLVYCRRPMTVREVFYEMVLQRLSHGFQLCQEAPGSVLPTTSSDLSSSKLGSPATSTSASLSPPGLTKPLAKPTPVRSSVWPMAGMESRWSRGSSSLGSSLHVVRRQTGPHQSTGTDVAVKTTGHSRPLTRHRHPSTPATADTTVTTSTVSTSNATNVRTCTTTTIPPSTVPLSRSLGLGLTLSQPTRTSNCRGLTARPQRSESLATVPNQPDSVNRMGPSSPVVVRLSMGRLFHSISLEDDSITLTNYRLRQDDERIQIEYKYALQVPDSDRFIQLKTLFTHEVNLMVNWSYLDNYLCTSGVSDSFVLLPSLKFWRTRFMVLPVYTNETKRLCDLIKERLSSGGPRVACDVYEADFRAMDPARICEKFTHFIESINRVRRSHPASRKMARQIPLDKTDSVYRSREFSGSSAYTVQTNQPGAAVSTAATSGTSCSGTVSSCTTVISSIPSNSTAVTPTNALGVGGRLAVAQNPMNSAGATPLQQQQRLLASGSDGSAPPMAWTEESPSIPTTTTTGLHVTNTCTTPGDMASQTMPPAQSQNHVALMNSTQTPAHLVVLLMADPDQGLPFISVACTAAFPERTFFAFDAVTWVMRMLSDMESVEHAVDYLQTLLDAGWIRHTSGNPSHRFIFGCYFYTLLVPDAKTQGPQGIVANVETLCPNIATDGSELAVHSTPVTPGPSSGHGVGGGTGNPQLTVAGMTTHVSHSTSSLAAFASTSSSLTRHSDSGHATAAGAAASTAAPQPIPFPESFLPRATPGPGGWTVDFQTEWMEIAFSENALGPASPRRTLLPVGWQDTDGQAHSGRVGSHSGLSYSTIGATCGVTNKVGFQEVDSVLRKSCVCDLDYAIPGDRSEWAHCVYDANYHPLCAFTMELQWLVASGSRLTELVSQWHQRARSNLHFFPVPCFPFGHPNIRSDADPLRHPIFVPCRMDRLSVSVTLDGHGSPASVVKTERTASESTDLSAPEPCEWNVYEIAGRLFSNFPQSQRLHMVRLFQDHLLRRFGFLPDAYDSGPQMSAIAQPTGAPVQLEPVKRWTYVHCSGGMFVMIPNYRSEILQNLSKPISISDSSSTPTLADMPREASRDPCNGTPVRTCHSRQLSQTWSKDTPTLDSAGQLTECFTYQTEIGYFWSWNHMLPRRWRGYLTGDESFQDAMLADFRAFMNCDDNRLYEAFMSFLANYHTTSSVA